MNQSMNISLYLVLEKHTARGFSHMTQWLDTQAAEAAVIFH